MRLGQVVSSFLLLEFRSTRYAHAYYLLLIIAFGAVFVFPSESALQGLRTVAFTILSGAAACSPLLRALSSDFPDTQAYLFAFSPLGRKGTIVGDYVYHCGTAALLAVITSCLFYFLLVRDVSIWNSAYVAPILASIGLSIDWISPDDLSVTRRALIALSLHIAGLIILLIAPSPDSHILVALIVVALIATGCLVALWVVSARYRERTVR